jgi:hypothetical protein
MSLGEANREAPAQADLRPPMVCVKLPKSVLVVFHLFFLEQRSCHFLGLKFRQMNHFESRFALGASLSGLRVDKAASYRRMSNSTANAIYASVQEERARPTYQRVLDPRANTGMRRSKVEGGLKSFSSCASFSFCSCASLGTRANCNAF